MRSSSKATAISSAPSRPARSRPDSSTTTTSTRSRLRKAQSCRWPTTSSKAGNIGSLVNISGLGILNTSANADGALALANYLLGEEAQTYFAENTFEYPLLAGVPTAPGLPPLAELDSPDIDLSSLADLEGTLALLAEVGLV